LTSHEEDTGGGGSAVFHVGMRQVLPAILAIALTVIHVLAAGQPTWSLEATPLPQFWDSTSETVAVPSPDKKLVLRVQGRKSGKEYPEAEYLPEYFLEKSGHRLHPEIRAYATPEALWSPDSAIMAITSSNGGLVGTWTVYTYTVNDHRVVKHEVMKRVQADLAVAFPAGIDPEGKSFFSLQDREKFARDPSWVNVVAVHWLKSPDRLVVLASVPASSGYGKNLGKRRGYIIDPIDGTIKQVYSEEEFKQAWSKYLPE
jgi:hypothetical protein